MTLVDTSKTEATIASKLGKPQGIHKIGLLGPFGGGNLGDAAIQKSAIENFRQLNSQLEICAFSLKPQDTEARHGIPTYPIGKRANAADYCWWRGKDNHSFATKLTDLWLSWQKDKSNDLVKKIGKKILTNVLEILAWWRAYRNFKQLNLDLLIVSGGGQLDDYWGGAWGHPFALLRWCLFSKLAGTKYLIVSVGAAPIDRPLSKLFTRITLSLADYRSYRDKDSQEYIERVVGFKRNDPVYADLAFSLPTESYRRSPLEIDCKGLVGIGAMSYFNPKSSWPQKDETIYKTYLNKLADFAVWLTDRDYALALFPGQTSHDKLAIDDFKELLQQKGVAKELIIDRSVMTVDDLMNQLIDLDIAVASRFHGVLLSLLLNKPTLALSYHPKIDMLMADIGVNEYCLQIDDFQLEVMKDKFNQIANNHKTITERLQAKTQTYKSSLIKQYEYISQNF